MGFLMTLATDEGLREAAEKALQQAEVHEGYREWVKNLAALFAKVQAAGLEERSSREFQEMLWETNPVSGLGSGTVSLGGALDDADFRRWFAGESLKQVPEDSEERLRYFRALYQSLDERLERFSTRTPRLKIFRALAALYPSDFSTLANVQALRDLYRLVLGPPPSLDFVRCHLEVSERFRRVIGSGDGSLESQARQITLPWLVFERNLTTEEAATQASPEVAAPGHLKLRPLPALRRRKGLTALKGGLATILKVISFVAEGLSREDLMASLRSEFPDYTTGSLGTMINVLKGEFFVLRQDKDQLSLTKLGQSLLEGGESSELLPMLLTQILGVDHVLVYLREKKSASQRELLDLLKVVNPGWTTDFAPSAMLKWLRDLSLTTWDKQGIHTLTEDGQYWASLIDWEPERLPTDEEKDIDVEAIAAPTTAVSLPALQAVQDAIKASDYAVDVGQLASLHVGLWAHPRRHFAILAGLSGSGKTMLARRYAQALLASLSLPAESHVFTLAVQPGWYDPSPLFGYVNPLRPDAYVRPAVLDFILRAVQNPSEPFVLILDEMNLSHPEQYLAPILSAMESGDCLRLHNEDLVFDGVPFMIGYPKNLCIIGTVNMDETTHGLSDKILDRAFTLEFWNVDLAAYPAWKRAALSGDEVGQIRGCLEGMIQALAPVRLHFGWRTISDVLDYADLFRAQQPAHALSPILDQAIYARVLPKLRGSSSQRLEKALEKVQMVLQQHDLPRSLGKVKELLLDLQEQGSMRFWR
ncbi:MAG: hypothetical protein K0Q68_1131 [Moraxellaceae bacterium]|jgi:MoxR-like ATPase|nr:hypothetical protein [Moraxellaceae bacterium]